MNPRPSRVPSRIPSAPALLRTTLLSLLLALPTLASHAAQPLRYRFPESQTNVYKVTLQTDFQETAVTLAGLLFARGLPLTDGNLHLAVHGHLALQPRSTPGQPSATPFPQFGLTPRGQAGLWIPGTLHFHPGHSGDTLDDSGRLVRDSGLPTRLPAPFTSLVELIVEPLPDTSRRESTVDSLVSVPDELPSPATAGMAPHFLGYHPGAAGPRLLTRLSRSSRITRSSDTSVHIASTLEMTSLLQSGNTPRFAASLQRTAVFDRTKGVLTSLDITCTATFATPNLTFRRPLTLQIRLLEGPELDRELQAASNANPSVPTTIPPAELEKLLADLGSTDPSRRQIAAHRLISGTLEQPTPALLATATRLATDADMILRGAAHHILSLHGGPPEVPALLRALPWAASQGNQRQVLEGLRRINDPRAIEPLADVIARGSSDVDFAAECLQSFGPAAEPAALRLLRERHAQTRRLACLVLGQVGTAASLAPVREQLGDPDPQLSQTATEAYRSLQTRAEPPANP